MVRILKRKFDVVNFELRSGGKKKGGPLKSRLTSYKGKLISCFQDEAYEPPHRHATSRCRGERPTPSPS